MIARVLVLVIAATACMPRGESALFVRDARMIGPDLVVTKCEVRADNNQIHVDRCVDEKRALPAAVVANATAPLDAALARCAAVSGVHAPVRLHIAIDELGHATAIDHGAGNAALVSCANKLVARWIVSLEVVP
jgi:hypothetical protein